MGCVWRAWKCGACVEVWDVQGRAGVCVGRVCCVHGVGGGGRSWCACVWRKERVSLAPLYYPDEIRTPA